MTDSRAIQVGDLVQIVRGHSCVVNIMGGIPFRVKKFVPQCNGGWICSVCGDTDIAPEEKTGAALWHMVPGNGIPVGWLKRIPPLSELEGERTEESLPTREQFADKVKQMQEALK